MAIIILGADEVEVEVGLFIWEIWHCSITTISTWSGHPLLQHGIVLDAAAA